MKTIKYMWVALFAVIFTGLASCTDNDGDSYPGGNDPVAVNSVYLLNIDDTVSTSRLVTFARLGQTIRLEGSGLGGIKEILVNGYSTYFNTAVATNNSLILALNSKTPVSDAPDSVRNTIQFIKKDGTAYTYQFDIRSASPQITDISCTLPAAGETVVVKGVNLQETSSVTLPGGIEVTDITNAPAGGDDEGEWFSFVMPSGVTGGGAITSVGTNGTAKSAEYFNDANDMIMNFDGNGAQGEWDGGTSFIHPTDLVADPLNSGRGNVCELIPERLLTTGIAAGNNRATEVWTGDNSWATTPQDIAATTPLTDVAFQFDIYVPDTWVNTGYIQINLANNSSFTGYGSSESTSIGVAYFIPWMQDGVVVPFQTSGWQTVTIPFSEFGVFATEIADGQAPTFADINTYIMTTDYKNLGMAFVNGDLNYGGVTYPAAVSQQKVYVDNFRVVPCAHAVVPDF